MGMSEDGKFGNGYDAIFGKKKEEKPAKEKKPAKAKSGKKAAAKKK